jgi:hypothetical protein
MGLFDTVKFSTKCPCCGEVIPEFQTKDNDACMNTVDPWTVSNFYASCDLCHAWVEYNLKPEFTQPSINNLMSAGHDLVKSIEDLLNERGDTNIIKERLSNNIFKRTIGHTWIDYYSITVNPPSLK